MSSEGDPDNTDLVEKVEEQENKVENLLNLECSLLKQKVGVKWDHEGERGLRNLASAMETYQRMS
ncbi:hypothetical protein FRX31_033744, partial [Thalictrum thalictroides]